MTQAWLITQLSFYLTNHFGQAPDVVQSLTSDSRLPCIFSESSGYSFSRYSTKIFIGALLYVMTYEMPTLQIGAYLIKCVYQIVAFSNEQNCSFSSCRRKPIKYALIRIRFVSCQSVRKSVTAANLQTRTGLYRHLVIICVPASLSEQQFYLSLRWYTNALNKKQH